MAENPIIAGFSMLANQICGSIARTFGTILNNQEEPHYLVFCDTNNLQLPYIPLAGGATAEGIAQIGADSDYVAVAIMRRAPTEANPLAADQPFSFRLQDGSSSRDLSNWHVHADLGMGNGWFPFYFAKPRIFSRNSSVKIEVTNLQAAAVIRAYVAFLGYKVYDKAMLDLTAQT
jgi:hypothetical protein